MRDPAYKLRTPLTKISRLRKPYGSCMRFIGEQIPEMRRRTRTRRPKPAPLLDYSSTNKAVPWESLGIDPGVRGGCAIVVAHDGAKPDVVDIIDIPVVGVGAKERVDVLALHIWIQQHRPDHAYIERAQAMPKQGASSGFKYRRAVGAIEAVLACCEIPMTIVEPTTWKKFHQLRGGDKESSRQRALQLFPCAHALLARKKDHGRAEAALIALAGANHGAP